MERAIIPARLTSIKGKYRISLGKLNPYILLLNTKVVEMKIDILLFSNLSTIQSEVVCTVSKSWITKKWLADILRQVNRRRCIDTH